MHSSSGFHSSSESYQLVLATYPSTDRFAYQNHLLVVCADGKIQPWHSEHSAWKKIQDIKLDETPRAVAVVCPPVLWSHDEFRRHFSYCIKNTVYIYGHMGSSYNLEAEITLDLPEGHKITQLCFGDLNRRLDVVTSHGEEYQLRPSVNCTWELQQQPISNAAKV